MILLTWFASLTKGVVGHNTLYGAYEVDMVIFSLVLTIEQSFKRSRE